MPDNRICIEVLHIDDTAVMTVDGEIDLATAPLLKEALERLDDGQHVVVDCAGMEFMDSTGLNLLVTQAKRVRQAGGSLHLRHTSPAAQRILKLSGLSGLIEPVGSRQDWTRSTTVASQ